MFQKFLRVISTAFWITLTSQAGATQTAQATLFCLSLRFQQGTDSSGSSTLDLSSLPGTPNGELTPWFVSYTHRSLFVLDWSGSPISGTIYLNIYYPPGQILDANGDGFDDNFQVAQAVDASTVGEYSTALGGGTITAAWNRAAGSKDGTCQLHLVDDTFGDLGVYRHTFEVLELTGPLTYTPGTNAVSGYMNLSNATDQLHGPVNFTKLAATDFNHLTRAAGVWTNVAWQTLTFSEDGIQRDWHWPTNYFGNVEFDDGDPSTGGVDYRWWVLSINDPNDSDHDGIPDFSDLPPPPAPRRPVLALARGSTDLSLTISGDVGRLHHILESSDPVAGNWKTNFSLVLTNDPQTVSLPLPSGASKFWRASVE